MRASLLGEVLELCDFATFRTLVSISTHADACIRWCQSQRKWGKSIVKACEVGDLDFVQWCLQVYQPRFPDVADLVNRDRVVQYTFGLIGATYGGHIDIARLMIAKGAKAGAGAVMVGACWNGDRPMVDLIIAHGNKYWNEGLRTASLRGREEIFYLMVSKGATNFNGALNSACTGGHQNMVDLAVQFGANDWSGGLMGAVSGKQRAMADLMIARGARITDEARSLWPDLPQPAE